MTAVLLIWVSVSHLRATDIELALLRSGTDVFTNVTVYGQSQTDLFIKHSRGYGNVKISSLDNATLRLLKLGGAPAEEVTVEAVSVKAAASVATLKARLSGMQWKMPSEAEALGLISKVRLSPNILAVALIVYLLYCVGLKLICLNAGSRPGLMIWIPVLQMFPVLRAARMSAWWFVVFLIPLLGVLAHIVLCVKIARACGKGALVAVLLILPGTNLLAFLYLALSTGTGEPEEKAAPRQRHTMVLGEA